MIDVLCNSLVLALMVNMMMLLPGFSKLKQYGKPWSCSYCLAFWISVIIGTFGLHHLSTLQMFFVTFTAPFLAVLFERLLASLPIKL